MAASSERQLVPGGTIWNDIVGYSRAIRVGNIIEVSGTVAVNDADGSVVGPNDIYTQTKFILQKIETAMSQVGGTISDVVRTRMFVTDIVNQWEDAGRAHGEIFKDIKPVSTMVQVVGLIKPELLIEIEVSAIVSGNK